MPAAEEESAPWAAPAGAPPADSAAHSFRCRFVLRADIGPKTMQPPATRSAAPKRHSSQESFAQDTE